MKDLLDGEEVGPRSSAFIDTRLGRNEDRVVVLSACRGLDVRFVEQATLFRWDLFAS